MYGEGFVLLLLLTVVTFSYLIIERKHLTKLWNKCKSLIFNYNKFKYNKRKCMSLLEFSRWQYRGEGNEYLAISLPQQRKILRLRKSTNPKGFISFVKNWCHQCFDRNVVADDHRAACFEKLNLEYYKVLVRLIGECFVQPSEEILLKRTDINKINKIVASSRPEYRKKKHIGYTCGSLLTDYAYLPIDWDVLQFSGPTFAVEIKPKQGWIPPNERIYQLCTYCLNQYIKLQNGEISAVSDYCPMDLFSGRKIRMNSAINNLLKNPQNNIKIFLEGGLIYGENNNQKLPEAIANIFEEENSTKEENNRKFTKELCDLITNALLKQIYSNNHNCPQTTTSNNNLNVIRKNDRKLKKCDLLSRNQLPRGCVLERILQLQQLDCWGAEQLSELLTTATSVDQQNISKNDYEHASFVAARAATKKSIVNNCARCFFPDLNLETSVQKYIMSAIAKDCSLMLTFRRLHHLGNIQKINEKNLIQTHLGWYAFNIGVFDLYPKPLSCIFKHVRKRTKFSQIYANITTSQFY